MAAHRKYDYCEIYSAVKSGLTKEEVKELYGVSDATLGIIITAGDAFTGFVPDQHPLSKFTPRQLMEELKRRGYTGKLQYVEVKTIDLNTF